MKFHLGFILGPIALLGAAMLAAEPCSAQLIKVDSSANSGSWIYAHGVAYGPKDGTAVFVDATHGLPVNCIVGCGAGTTIADGGDVAEGAQGDAAAAADNSTASLISLLKRNNQRLTTLINALNTPAQNSGSSFAIVAGSALIGKAGIDQTTPGTTNNVTTDGAVDGTVHSDSVSSATTGYSFSTVGFGSVTFQIVANAGANRIVVEGSNDGGATWSGISTRVTTNDASGAASTGTNGYINGAGVAFYPNTMMPMMRWKVSSYSSGTTTVATGFKRFSVPTVVDAYIGGGTVGTTPTLSGASAGGTPLATSFILSSAASTNSTLVITSAHRVVGGQVCNTTASPKFTKLYNKATAPTVGTDTPLTTITIPANQCVSIPTVIGDLGQYFNLGIGLGITGAFATSDTTSVGAGDVTVNLLNL